MFLYNIHYDKESNTVTGDKIIIPEGVSTNSRIELSADIDNGYDIFIDFSLPKSRKIRSERMEYVDGKYCLTIPDTVTVATGNAEIQLIFIRDEVIEKSFVNSQILVITPSINAVDTIIKNDKTILDTLVQDNLEQNLKLAEHQNKLNNHNSLINECKTLATTNKFDVEIIYDKSSSSSSLNHGFPNGLFKGNRINGLNLSKYRYLIIDCQEDRTMTMFMDLTEKNYLNNFYINTMSGIRESSKKFATISFEIIVNLTKTYFHLNNTACSSGYSVAHELTTNTSMYVSKIVGII